MNHLDNAGQGEGDGVAAGAERVPRAPAPGTEWHPPTTRDDAEAQIRVLSTDIGMILAQLAEDQSAWCDRTGRSPADHAQWRRRALFAKVYKEHQLRECKRVRAQMAGVSVEPEPAFVPEAAVPELARHCRRAVDAWRSAAPSGEYGALNTAMQRMADYLDGMLIVDAAPMRVLGVAEGSAAR